MKTPLTKKKLLFVGTFILTLAIGYQSAKLIIQKNPSPSPSLSQPTSSAIAADEGAGYYAKKNLSVADESYVLFFKKWAQEFPQWLRPGEKLPNAKEEEQRWGIANREGVEIFQGTPTKIPTAERDDYLKCIQDKGTCSCTDPDQCENWVTSHCSQKCCSWSNPQGISGPVMKIGDQYTMFAHLMMIFQSEDGLRWKLPSEPLKSTPIKLGPTDPWGRFGKPYTADNQCYYTESTFRWAGAWPQNAYWYDMRQWQKYPEGKANFILDWNWYGVFEDKEETDPTKRFKWISFSSPDGEANRNSFPNYKALRLAYSADGLHWREATFDLSAADYQSLSDQKKKDCFPKDEGEGYFCYLSGVNRENSPAVPGGLYNLNPIPHWRAYMEPLGGCSYNPQAKDPNFRWKCFSQAHGVDRYPASREIGIIHAAKAEGPWLVSDGPSWPDSIALSFYGHGQNMYFGDETHPNPGPQTHGGWPWVYQGYEFLLYGYLDLRDPARSRTNIRLATSLDGWHYNLIGGTDTSLINHSPPYDRGIIWGAWPTVVGDEIWIYYNGGDCFYYSGCTDWSKRGGLAKIRLDGFTYVSPTKDCTGSNCYLETEPITVGDLNSWSFAEMAVNVKADASNTLQVELLNSETNQPLTGFSLADSDPLNVNQVSAKVGWKGNTNLKSLAAQGVGSFKARFYLQGGKGEVKLYSYHFLVSNGPKVKVTAKLPHLKTDNQKQTVTGLLRVQEKATSSPDIYLGQTPVTLTKTSGQNFSGEGPLGFSPDRGKTYVVILKIKGYLPEKVGEFTWDGEEIPPFTNPIEIAQFGDLPTISQGEVQNFSINPQGEDDKIDQKDVNSFLEVFKSANTLFVLTDPTTEFLDVNGDGRIDILDLSLLLKNLPS